MSLLDELLLLDIQANPFATGRTISADLGQRIVFGLATAPERALCSGLNYFEQDHCVRAYGRAVLEDLDEWEDYLDE